MNASAGWFTLPLHPVRYIETAIFVAIVLAYGCVIVAVLWKDEA